MVQSICFGKRCVSKYLCRVRHTSHHNKQQASPSKQICCELVTCVNSEQPLPPPLELHNYLSTCSWLKILYLNTQKFTQARISVVLITNKSVNVLPNCSKNYLTVFKNNKIVFSPPSIIISLPSGNAFSLHAVNCSKHFFPKWKNNKLK